MLPLQRNQLLRSDTCECQNDNDWLQYQVRHSIDKDLAAYFRAHSFAAVLGSSAACFFAENMEKLIASKPVSFKKKTQKALKDLPAVVTLYRGEGEQSTPTDKAWSWTTDINQANFFASRYGREGAKIITATAPKDRIDDNHGTASVDYYIEDLLEDEDYNPVTAFLIKYHSLPDEEGYSFIENDAELSEDKDRITMLFEIFKDADGLDRIRFGVKDIDLNQIRLAKYS